MTTAFLIWLVLLGPVVASFLSAVADRVCAGESVLAPRSHCSTCGSRIAAADLVPILSWLWLRARCRKCNAPIPIRLWLAEVAGLLLVLAAVWKGETALGIALGALFLLLLLGLFQTDLLCMRLPDFLTLPLLVAGSGLGAMERGIMPTAIAAALGPAALWMIGWAYRQRRGRMGLGLGDVKLMAGLSAAVGPLAIPWITLLAATTALSVAFWRRSRGEAMDRFHRIAFGCHLAVSGGLVWIATS